MKKLTDGLILFHGSYCPVKKPDLKFCGRYKDFGKGFYLTSSEEQARSFVRASVKQAAFSGKIGKEQSYGVVSKYLFRKEEALQTFIYETANIEWLHCIVGHRKKNTFPEIVSAMEQQDVIVGKIANDQTNATITAYMASVYGEIGSKTADDICISLLLPERLQDQFCFRTERALSCLTFMESEQIWL